MIGCYYAIRMYIEQYPEQIHSSDLMSMADEISELLGCSYDQLGYMLLHPDDYDKDLGNIKENNVTNRADFAKCSIPMTYQGKEEMPSAPSICFLRAHSGDRLPDYEICLHYPMGFCHYLSVDIDIKESLLSGELTLQDFVCLQEIIRSYGFVINSAYVHYYTGNMRRAILDQGEQGFMTINDRRICAHSVAFMVNWQNKLMDVFYMNAIPRVCLSDGARFRLREIVGPQNVMESSEYISFRLPQTKSIYLLNRLVTTPGRRNVKALLESEKVCEPDVSVIKALYL